MTTVYFIRHGEAEGNTYFKCHGHFDGQLTEKGVLQAKLTADKLADVKFDKIYSSDLSRAYNTAVPVAESHNLGIIKDTGLREIDVGDWEDKTWDYIDKYHREEYDLWKHQPEKMKAPNGESMVQVRERIVSVVDRIVADNPDSVICIVTHCCVLKNLMCYYKGKDLSHLNEEWICNASYSIVDFDDSRKGHIVSISNVSHLEELGYIDCPPWNQTAEHSGETVTK